MDKWVLPDGWEWKKLGDESLLEIIMGQSPPGESYNDEGKGLPFFQGKTDFGDYYPTPRKWCTAPTKISLPGDVLISVRAPVGPTNLTADKCAIGRGLTILRPKPTLQTNFLLYSLRSLENQISEMGKGSTFVAITKSDLEQIEIPYTDPDTQAQVVTRIEEFLAELAEARRLHEKIVTDTNRLMDAVLADIMPNPENELFEGWGAIPLSELAKEEPNQIIPSQFPSETFNYWGLDAISESQITEPPPNYILGSEIKSTCVSFSEKHVLYSKLRPYLNKVIVPSINGIGSTEWVVYEPNPNIIRREYLAFVMRTKWFVNLASGSSYGARMPRANKSVLRTTKIPIPLIAEPNLSLSVQDQIIDRISQFSSEVETMRKGNRQQEELLGQLEQSILAQAFRGEM